MTSQDLSIIYGRFLIHVDSQKRLLFTGPDRLFKTDSKGD